eukprot:m.207201 g.207201  ORF g.207201 m.207201 type:complete len:122 (-) comp18922_c0_seq1:509-874(-)
MKPRTGRKTAGPVACAKRTRPARILVTVPGISYTTLGLPDDKTYCAAFRYKAPRVLLDTFKVPVTKTEPSAHTGTRPNGVGLLNSVERSDERLSCLVAYVPPDLSDTKYGIMWECAEDEAP